MLFSQMASTYCGAYCFKTALLYFMCECVNRHGTPQTDTARRVPTNAHSAEIKKSPQKFTNHHNAIYISSLKLHY